MGYFSAVPGGRVVKANRTFCAWLGRPAEEVLGARFQDFLTPGGQVYAETHLLPLLRMQGAVREIALDLRRADGSVLPCLVNAVEVRDDAGAAVLLRATVFEATARRRYERDLLAARRAAEESEARSRVLQHVVSDLAATVSVEDVATVIVQRSRAALRARGAALVVVVDGEEGGAPGLRFVRTDGLPPTLLEEFRATVDRGLVRELPLGVRSVPLDEALHRSRPGLAAAMARAAVTELVVVPVTADSRQLGVLALVLGEGVGDLISLHEPGERPPLPEADVDLLRTIGRQAGQALERARLHEETSRQAERAAFLLEAARLLAGAADVTETVERLAALAVERLADVCVIDLVTEVGTRRTAARHRDPARQRLLDELRARQLPQRSDDHPSVRALAEGRTQWVRSPDDAYLRRITVDEQHLAISRALELAGLVAVPLVADGRRLGVVTFGADRARGSFTAADVEMAEQLGLQLALVVAKAQRYDLEVRTSHELQASLLPASPPEVPGLGIAVRYLPATYGVEVGGDFYDVVPLADHVALAVGDVVGHDITAAASMGQLGSVYRALLVDGPAPSAVIDRLQASWSLLGLQRMATALFASLAPATGQLRMASAGHLPPLLLSGGTASYLPVVPTRMLGAPPAPTPAVEWAGVLAAGDTLLLYTDGLVESRTADVDEGMDRLLQVAASAGTSEPDELLDRVLAELTGPHRGDDIALLALTRR
ncbi:histidine kinase [Blastococcus sp. TF02A-30]|nr:histidine kinase [Blastococcus sp. TF02A-30]